MGVGKWKLNLVTRVGHQVKNLRSLSIDSKRDYDE